jgi:hypothetical protein
VSLLLPVRIKTTLTIRECQTVLPPGSPESEVEAGALSKIEFDSESCWGIGLSTALEKILAMYDKKVCLFSLLMLEAGLKYAFFTEFIWVQVHSQRRSCRSASIDIVFTAVRLLRQSFPLRHFIHCPSSQRTSGTHFRLRVDFEIFLFALQNT